VTIPFEAASESVKKMNRNNPRERDIVNTTIAVAQANNGDIKAALESAKKLNRNNPWSRDFVYMTIAVAQAKNGNIKAALESARKLQYYGNFAYRDIAYTQVLKGDLDGARKTATLIEISDPSSLFITKGTEWIEIVIFLKGTTDSSLLQERADVILKCLLIIDILKSHPWFIDLTAYLSHLNAMDQPEDIERGVCEALEGVGMCGREWQLKLNTKDGMLTILETLRYMDKPYKADESYREMLFK
jgi:hypothetical protein